MAILEAEEMPRKGKDIPEDETALWEQVMADVTPMPGRQKPASRPAPVQAKTIPAVQIREAAPARGSAAPAGRDLDRRTQQKLERGQMEIEAVLDLHGYGRGEAREKLAAFMAACYARDMRCVLVITGKGKGGDGVLRRDLPDWMDESPFSGIVLRATPARGKHGGSGAFYVLLRRRRTL